jgi:serine/threonine-protein kinase
MPEPGAVIAGRYLLERTLSSGGMGSVYVASHTQTGRRFALKVMLADLTGDREAELRFLREAKLAGSINHPCVIRVYDVGHHGQHPYMVMELLEGESLGQRLKRGRYLAQEAAALLLRVLEGVAALHGQGIVHRDLKPDNIFLCRSPDGRSVEPKVLDFGISKSLSTERTQQLTRTGIALGTPLYMSPEQVHGVRDVDQRADVYALGVILYEMLAGQVPYDGRNYAELVLKIITGDAPSLQSYQARVPESLEGVVRKAMAVDRQQRYANVAELAADLRAFAQGVLPQAPRMSSARPQAHSLTPFSTEATREPQAQEPFGLPRRNAPLLLMAACAGALIAAGGFWVVRPARPHHAGAPAATHATATQLLPATSPPRTREASPQPTAATPARLELPADAGVPQTHHAPLPAGRTPAQPRAQPGVAQHTAGADTTAEPAPVVTTTKLPASPAPTAAPPSGLPPRPRPPRTLRDETSRDNYGIHEEKLIDPFER